MKTHHTLSSPFASAMDPRNDPAWTSAVRLMARIFLVAVFLFSAIDKAFHFDAAAREMQAVGLPMPQVTAALVILTQAVGSVLLLTTRTALVGGVVLAGFTLLSTIIAHDFWNADNRELFTRQLTTFLEHLGIIGGLMLAALPCRPSR